MNVGFVGVGAMGKPMALNLLKAGFKVSVWARRPEAAEDLCSKGASWTDSPRELAARSDATVMAVTNSPDVQQVVTGADGILEGASPGHVIVDMSTISPVVTRSIYSVAREAGCDFIDAPVSGGTQGAQAGTLTIMAGGDAPALERILPILEALGGRIFHVGPSGAGQVVKLVNNMLVGTIAAATCEALVLGRKAGADVATMAEVVGAATGASWQLANQLPLRAFTGSFSPGFMTDLLCKDLDLALQLGAENHSPMFFTALARQVYGEAQAAGHGRDDYTSVMRVLEEVAGVEVRIDKGPERAQGDQQEVQRPVQRRPIT